MNYFLKTIGYIKAKDEDFGINGYIQYFLISSTNNSEKGGIQDYIFTLNYTEQNVPIGAHKVEVACRKINASSSSAQFAIGRNVSNTNNVSNAFTLESMMKIDLLEYVTYEIN